MFGVLAVWVINIQSLIAPHPPELPRYHATVELGAALSWIPGPDLCGYGITMSYPWSGHAILEAEYVHYFDDDDSPRSSVFLAGMRSGIRMSKVGVFAKLLPGFFRGGGSSSADSPSSMDFALSAGGVLEVYATRRVYTRFDTDVLTVWSGDTTAKHRRIRYSFVFRF